MKIKCMNFMSSLNGLCFARSVFEYELTKHGRSYWTTGEQKVAYFRKDRQQGRPKIWWLRNHKLTSESLPIEWVMALLMEKRRKFSDLMRSVFEGWTSWKNLKGILWNFGEVGGLYPTRKPFTRCEVKEFVGLYILNGTSISPRIEYKFRSQEEDPVNDSDFCNDYFGCQTDLRFIQFRLLFVIQNLMLTIPSRK